MPAARPRRSRYPVAVFLAATRPDVRLLTRDEEVALGRALRCYALAPEAHRRAEEVFVLANQGLIGREIASLARRGRIPPGLDPEDLWSEANLALLRAARMWDPERGIRFSTYAVWAIKNALRRPMELWARSRLGQAIDAAGPDVLDVLVDHRGDQAAAMRAEHERSEAAVAEVRAAMGRLPGRERDVLAARMEGQTLRAIGESCGVSKERIRQVEMVAIDRLQRELTNRRRTA